MKHLKKELFFKLVDDYWLELHYSNEKFDLYIINDNQKIKFKLINKKSHNIVLSGLVIKNNESIDFKYNIKESSWLKEIKNSESINYSEINDLLENLFCSMLIQGDSK